MTDLTVIETSELLATIKRAQSYLDDGDTQRALMLSSAAYDQAKAAGAYAERVKASRTLVEKARRLQADALKIEALSYCAMADAVDEAQDKGEIIRTGRPKSVSDENTFTLDEVGIDRQHLHHARKLRNAEKANPGFVDDVIEARLSEGLEPSRASLKKAAGHAVGTKTRTREERGTDSYFTAPEALPVLLALESFSGVVKEPACGAGHISSLLEAAGYSVMISDIVDRGTSTRDGEVQAVGDFLESEAGETAGYDIVTNPPYGRHVMNRFIAHAIREHKPRKMALLLNLNAMCGCEDRDRLFIMEECPPTRVYVFSRRLPMMHQEGWDGNEQNSQMNVAWFVWEQNDDGSYGDPQGGFRTIRVDWQHYADAEPLEPGAGGCVAPLKFRSSLDDDLQRETPRKTLDERVDADMDRALAWIRDTPSSFDSRALRMAIAVRPITADGIIARLADDGRLIAVDGGWSWAGDAKAVAA